MVATVSSVWAKPGAWALDSEEHEDELKRDADQKSQFPEPPATAEFPSLATAAAAKPKKKNKPQTLSLAEFSNYGSAPRPSPEPQRLTQNELLMLPTGPRQRTADELDQTRLGGGFKNYGGGSGDSSRVRARVSDGNRERDSGPSRADEVDDWSKMKRVSSFGGGSGPERRETVGFFNSSRADEVDNWAANKSFGAQSEGPRRVRRTGFESYSNGLGPDSDNWSKKKEARAGDSDNWGRREEGEGDSDNGRPRLNLQPRTLPVVNNNGQGHSQSRGEGKPKGANPFGEAKPREEVLAEKGKDWKEIDEKLEAMKIKEVGVGDSEKGEGFGIGRSEPSDQRTVKSWRKPESDDAPPSSVEVPENIDNAETAPEEK